MNARQEKIKQEIKKLGKVYKAPEVTAAKLLKTISNTYKIYAGSKVERKREILKKLLSNFQVDGKKALFKLKTPYKQVFLGRECHDWSGLVWEVRTGLTQS